MMPVRTDAFSRLCFLLEHMQRILFLMGNQFSCHTYLSNKFLTTWLYYSPKFSLFLTCLMSKVPLQKPNQCPRYPHFCYIWPSSCLSYHYGCPTIMPYIVAIEFGCPTVHTRTTRVKRGITNYCLEYRA